MNQLKKLHQQANVVGLASLSRQNSLRRLQKYPLLQNPSLQNYIVLSKLFHFPGDISHVTVVVRLAYFCSLAKIQQFVQSTLNWLGIFWFWQEACSGRLYRALLSNNYGNIILKTLKKSKNILSCFGVINDLLQYNDHYLTIKHSFSCPTGQYFLSSMTETVSCSIAIGKGNLIAR